MHLFFNITLFMLTAISGIIAIRGETWNKVNNRFTCTGYIAIMFILFTLANAIYLGDINNSNDKEQKENQQNLQTTIDSLNENSDNQDLILETMLLNQQAALASDKKTKQTITKQILINKPYGIKWNNIFGSIEILQSDCEFYVNLKYQKSKIIMEETQIKARLDTVFPSFPFRKYVLDFIPSKNLTEKLDGNVLLRSDRDDTFGKGSIISTELIISTLKREEKIDIFSILLMGPLVIEFIPIEPLYNDICDLTYYPS